MSRWVIVGSSGYLGEALCRYLVAAGEAVCSVSRSEDGPAKCEHRRVKEFAGVGFEGLFKVGDKVVYAAGVANRFDCLRNPGMAYYLNAELPVGLLELADRAGAESFTYISSVKAMHLTSAELSTEHCGVPATDVYGESKWRGEQNLLAKEVQCRVNLVRPAAVYGEYESKVQQQVQQAVGQLTSRGKPAIGRGRRLPSWIRYLPVLPATGRRSFIALVDLLRALKLVADSTSCDRKVFIVAEPRFYDVADIATVAGGFTGKASRGLMAFLTRVLRPIAALPLASRVLELSGDELYSASQLRTSLSWQANRRYGEFLQEGL